MDGNELEESKLNSTAKPILSESISLFQALEVYHEQDEKNAAQQSKGEFLPRGECARQLTPDLSGLRALGPGVFAKPRTDPDNVGVHWSDEHLDRHLHLLLSTDAPGEALPAEHSARSAQPRLRVQFRLLGLLGLQCPHRQPPKGLRAFAMTQAL